NTVVQCQPHQHVFPPRRSADHLRPEGAPYDSPGQRPGSRSPPNSTALKGRSNSRRKTLSRPDDPPPDPPYNASIRPGSHSANPEIGKHTSELQSRENLVCRLLL